MLPVNFSSRNNPARKVSYEAVVRIPPRTNPWLQIRKTSSHKRFSHYLCAANPVRVGTQAFVYHVSRNGQSSRIRHGPNRPDGSQEPNRTRRIHSFGHTVQRGHTGTRPTTK